MTETATTALLIVGAAAATFNATRADYRVTEILWAIAALLMLAVILDRLVFS